MAGLKKHFDYLARFALVLALMLTSTALVSGQLTKFGKEFSPFGKKSGGEEFKMEASFKSKPGTNEGTLTLNLKLGSHWHIYSLTQEAGGPIRTKILLDDSSQFELAGDFEPDSDPVTKQESFSVPSEYHEGSFNWTAPVVFADGVDPATVEIKGKLKGQRCLDGGSCVLVNERFVAKYGGEEAVFNASSKFHPERTHLLLSGKVILPESAKGLLNPGGTGIIEITAEPTDGYHLYERQATAPDEAGNKPVLLAVTKSNDWEFGMIENVAPSADKVKVKAGELTKYKGTVSWRVPFTVPKDAQTKDYLFAGVLGFQTCTDAMCDPPGGTKWELSIPVGKAMASGGAAVAWKESLSYSDVAKSNEAALASANVKAKPNAGEYADKGAAFVLPIAFLAGFILNFMPCVLPVIGLKLMSFVHQAGEEPGKVFKLNLVFALGILAVFMVLAALAVFASFGWGEAFESTLFKIIMIGVVFAFGISFFGIWEIPIPGLANSSTANELAQKDGYSGQFFKGVLTTILATPCAGPMLIPAVIWAVAQPAWMTFTVFLALGLGMAVPYLIIGAFPKLISYLPKPGPWMETFKHVMGFVMLATVIFLLNAVSSKLTTAVLVFLLFIAFACWMLGREQLEGGLAKVFKRWAVATATIAFGVWFSFFALLSSHELNYEEYSRVALDSHLAEGRTVLVDFTADW